MGVIAGLIILKPENRCGKTMIPTLLTGILITAAGLTLHPWIPLNKNLWSPPYVLFSGGMALIIFMLCRSIMDRGKAVGFTIPLISLGMNPLAVYIASSAVARLSIIITWTENGAVVTAKQFLYSMLFGGWGDTPAASLSYALICLAVWTLAAELLRRKKIMIKL
jgi:predicted acyltransferase